MTDRAVERAVVGAGQHRDLETNLRDPEHRERSGPGSLSALRQALTRSGDQSDWSGVTPCAGATAFTAAKRSRSW